MSLTVLYFLVKKYFFLYAFVHAFVYLLDILFYHKGGCVLTHHGCLLMPSNYLIPFCILQKTGHEVQNNPYLLDSACDYVLIRALSMPTSLIVGVVQAALLGAKDSVTPLIAILYSTVVNVIGDYILVNRFNMGLQGAAIATTLAQWAATAAMIGPAKRELVKDHNLGILRRAPSVVTGRAFLAFAAPVLTLILGKLAAFGFMTHSAAAVPGQPLPLATHQIILSLFFFVSPFLEVISQTAQTFLVRENREKMKQIRFDCGRLFFVGEC